MSIVLVARKAGVSTATVSRVLNDLPGVRDHIKRQVRAAVEELNYVVPLVKRGPKAGTGRKIRSTRRTDTIAVVAVGNGIDWLQLPVMAASVGGITREATRTGFKVLLDEMRDVSRPSSHLTNGDVDGAIVFLSSGMNPEQFRNALSSVQRYVPVVWAMGGDAGIPNVDHVIPDDRAITRLAFEYLRANNRTNLAFVTTAPRWAMMRNRGQVFASLAHDAGISWSVYLVSDDPSDGDLFGRRAVVEKSLSRLVDRLANALPRPDGIFIGNDATAALVHPMLLQRGIQPAKDMLLVSCDNEDVRLHGLDPRPMSIDIGSADVGAAAVRRLRFRIENPGEPPIMIKVAPSMPDDIRSYNGGLLV